MTFDFLTQFLIGTDWCDGGKWIKLSWLSEKSLIVLWMYELVFIAYLIENWDFVSTCLNLTHRIDYSWAYLGRICNKKVEKLYP